MSPRHAACLLFTLSLAACAAEVEQRMPALNPAPTEAYRVEFWVEAPPRPMQLDSVQAVYQVVESDCLPRRPISGASAVSWNLDLPVQFEEVGKGRFATLVYADLLMPGDLYGEGACEWRLTNVLSMWNDGSLSYRHFGRHVPNDGVAGAIGEFSAFPRNAQGWREDGAALPVSAAIAFGDYTGVFPTLYGDDTSSRYYRPKRIDPRVPKRQVSPDLDFLILSAGRPIGTTASGANRDLDP